jgi:putative hydrolase of the HAD superfamily
MIRALVFDLDDTLYREHDFVASGYRAVAEYVAGLSGRPAGEILGAMQELFIREGRRAVMQAVAERFSPGTAGLDELVAVYRKHEPAITLFAGYEDLLKEWRRTYLLGIITDGTPEVQERKCRALGLYGAVDRILCTWNYGREREKPHPHSFHRMLTDLSVRPIEALYIGDSVDKDCRGARGVGMRSVLVRPHPVAGAAEAGEQAEFVVESLFHVPMILKQLEERNESA